MAFPHPFSASSKPLPSEEYWKSTNPLPFAATLNQGPLFENQDLNGEGKRRAGREDDSGSFGASSHLAQGLARLELQSELLKRGPVSAGSSAALSPTLTDKSLPGEDDDAQAVAERKIAECVLLDQPRLDLTGMGLQYLPDDIANLRYIFHLERKAPTFNSTTLRGDPYKTPPGSPSAKGPRMSPGDSLRRTRPWVRSSSLPASMITQPSIPGGDGTLISPWKQSLRGSYSNPLGLGPPPSSRSGTFDAFLPPGSPVLERDDEDDELAEASASATKRASDRQPISPLKGRGQTMSARRNVTAPASSKLRVRFGAELDSPDAGLPPRGESSSSPSASSSSSSSSPEAGPMSLHRRAVEPPNTPTRSPARRQDHRIEPSGPSPTLDRSRKFVSAKSLSAVTFDRDRAKRTMQRTPSGFYEPSGETSWNGEGGSDLALYLSHNAIKCLPSSLFLITNLTVLSLRANQIERMPAGVGQLKRLKELNVSNNLIRSFPPSILDLKELTLFNCINNPLIRTPNQKEPSGRILGPLITTRDGETSATQVPSLHDLCLAKLLSTSEPGHIPPLLSHFDWNPEGGENHALQSPNNLRKHLKHLSLEDCARVIQALRSASDAKQARSYDQGLPENISSPARRRLQRHRRERETSLKEDAADNPFFAPCPNPRHYRRDEASDTPRLSKWVYLQSPAEERIQYVEVAGEKNIPIRWEGCCRGCLDFLVETEVADDPEADGFDVAVLEEDDAIPWATQA